MIHGVSDPSESELSSINFKKDEVSSHTGSGRCEEEAAEICVRSISSSIFILLQVPFLLRRPHFALSVGFGILVNEFGETCVYKLIASHLRRPM